MASVQNLYEVSTERLGPGNLWTLSFPSLGNNSYIIESQKEALIVDPNRNIEAIVAILDREGIAVKGVIDSHIHNDYTSGGFSLSQSLGVSYYLPKVPNLQFSCKNYEEASPIDFGEMSLIPLETPGHTWEHHAFLLSTPNEHATQNLAAFTGGSWLAGGAGRSDLVDSRDTLRLAELQWESIRRIRSMLSPNSRILPTHGNGSYCVSGKSITEPRPTVLSESSSNPVFTYSLEEWLDRVGLESRPIPKYFPQMAPRNLQGVMRFIPKLPQSISYPDLLTLAGDSSAQVVDIRRSEVAMESLIAGAFRLSVSAPVFTTWFGWLIPEDKDIYLAGGEEEVVAALHLLAQIGREQVAGYSPPPPKEITSTRKKSTRVLPSFSSSILSSNANIIDLRHPIERKNGHLRGSFGMPLEGLGGNLLELDEKPLFVHCSGGFRAAAATSVIESWLPDALVEVLLGPFDPEDAEVSNNICFRKECVDFCEG